MHRLAAKYGVPVILHTDHCAKNLLPWVDGMLEESEAYYKMYAHMISRKGTPLK